MIDYLKQLMALVGEGPVALACGIAYFAVIILVIIKQGKKVYVSLILYSLLALAACIINGLRNDVVTMLADNMMMYEISLFLLVIIGIIRKNITTLKMYYLLVIFMGIHYALVPFADYQGITAYFIQTSMFYIIFGIVLLPMYFIIIRRFKGTKHKRLNS